MRGYPILLSLIVLPVLKAQNPEIVIGEREMRPAQWLCGGALGLVKLFGLPVYDHILFLLRLAVVRLSGEVSLSVFHLGESRIGMLPCREKVRIFFCSAARVA